MAEWLGRGLLWAGLIGFGGALGRLRGAFARGADGAPWWFGYARDLVNLVAVGVTTLALWLGGFAPPLALLSGFVVTLLTYVTDYALAYGLGLRTAAGWVAGLVGVGVALPLVVARTQCTSLLQQLLERLF
ncbi:MAG TPA: hypothetical protein VKN99_22870 [Polyangia bacterium]|nr:hypothetical protein [Polyangia bacterium]